MAEPITWNYLSDEFDAADLEAVESRFQELEARALADPAEVARWLEDESELGSSIGAKVARAYVRMTCHTDDEGARDGYLSLQRELLPKVKIRSDKLNRKLLATDAAQTLDAARYEVLLRSRRTSAEIFREANTELQKKQSELQTRQQEIAGGIVVPFQGKDHTLQQMAPYGEEQDRDLRRRAFEAALDARRPTWEESEGLFDRLVDLRQQMAQNADQDSYVALRFLEMERFDYTPADCKRFHDAVEQTVVPAVRRLDSARQKALGVDSLRPWDLDVDIDGRPPFRPFETVDQLVGIVSSLFRAVDPRFADEFQLLVDNDLLDLMSREGKAPGGYQYQLEDVRLPFIFCNSVGLHGDVQTLLHEGGHAFHSILSRMEPLYGYRHSPIEFAETASMSMELMGLEHLTEVYDSEEARVIRRKHLEGILRILPWIASIDAFQHWVYADPKHDRVSRRGAWLDIRERLAPGIDFTDYEDAQANRWLAQPHLFSHPLYYIEYGIAQLAALQVWLAYRRDPEKAVADYRAALSLGGSRPLPELFETAGVRFDFGPELMGELVAAIEAEL